MRVTVCRWTGQEAAALRCAMRLSLREFAARLGVSDRMVSRWEAAGRHIQPRPFTQALLDTALRRADDETVERFVQTVRRCGGSGDHNVARSTRGQVARR